MTDPVPFHIDRAFISNTSASGIQLCACRALTIAELLCPLPASFEFSVRTNEGASKIDTKLTYTPGPPHNACAPETVVLGLHFLALKAAG